MCNGILGLQTCHQAVTAMETIDVDKSHSRSSGLHCVLRFFVYTMADHQTVQP